MEKRAFLKNSLLLTSAAVTRTPRAAVSGAPIRLRIAHFQTTSASAHTKLFQPWAKRIETESDGQIQCEIYPAMQLGGKPAQLFDQVRTGVADIAWTLPGYTPGRFPKSALFELPFVCGSSARATAMAIWQFYKAHLREEFSDVHVLLLHCNAPGLLHMKDTPISRLEDLKGKKIRLPSRPVGDALRFLQASPVGIPLPETYEALSRGVVDGITVPWVVMTSSRLNELINFHTYTGLYSSVFLMAMNRKKYESLPQDLREIIDRNSGDNLIEPMGIVWDEDEVPSREEAKRLGHEIIELPEAEKARWREATFPVIEKWTASVPQGAKLYEEARALIAKFE